MKIMRIGFYSPYLNTMSGGERYVLALAAHWSKNHSVEVFWDDPAILSKAQERLHLDLTKVRVAPNVFGTGSLLKKLLVSRTYDLILFLSDGSVPTSLAKHNILHFQLPFAKIIALGWKLGRYDAIVCNSRFTKDNLDPALQNKSIVIYPPVNTGTISTGKKENIILTVGRFHETKKQNILIGVFKKLASKKEYAGWRLICIGGLLLADEQYFLSLKKISEGYPITLIPNGTYAELESFYEKASIYWHAAGFGEQDPTLQEHFGISTVEAMAHGCIPVVYNGGGLVEIVTEGKNGYLWKTEEDLLEKTLVLLSNQPLTQQIRQLSEKRSHDFDEIKFFTAFDNLLFTMMNK